MENWQPIESAPKDGTRILAKGRAYSNLVKDGFDWGAQPINEPMVDGFVTIIRWFESWYDREVEVGEGLFRKETTLAHAYWKPHAHAFEPTHWMPLPSP